MRKTIMKKLLLLCLAAFLLGPFSAAQGENDAESGYVCISPIPEPNGREIALSNAAGGSRDFNFSVQVDDGEIIHLGFNKGAKYENLPLRRKHIVEIRRSGKLIESFWFGFDEYQSSVLCLWFNPLYMSWSLWKLEDSKHLCDCAETS